ncbi:MAG: hypothetical protein ACU0DI_05535 [Paracoccaceae bacterium]
MRIDDGAMPLSSLVRFASLILEQKGKRRILVSDMLDDISDAVNEIATRWRENFYNLVVIKERTSEAIKNRRNVDYISAIFPEETRRASTRSMDTRNHSQFFFTEGMLEKLSSIEIPDLDGVVGDYSYGKNNIEDKQTLQEDLCETLERTLRQRGKLDQIRNSMLEKMKEAYELNLPKISTV